MPKRRPSEDRLPFISASSRAAFKRCRYQWHFRYMRQLEPKIAAPPLRFGTLLHTALELYYPVGVKRGPHPARTFEREYEKEFAQAKGFGFKDEDGKWHDALSLGVDMLEHYTEHYGKDDEWRIIATEAVFEEPVYWPPTGERIGTYIGVLDLIAEHRASGELWFWDHKGVKTIDTNYLSMDDQSSGYWTFGEQWLRRKGVLKPDKNLQGIKFNFLRKAERDERPQDEHGHYLNKDGSVSQKQPSPYFERFTSYRGEAERDHTRERCAHELVEMGLVREGALAILKTPDKMHCKFCDVRDICELHETGADWAELARMILTERRPMRHVAVEFEHDH